MTDYDSRRTGNGLLDTGSTPVWSTRSGTNELPSDGKTHIANTIFVCIVRVGTVTEMNIFRSLSI